MRRLTLEQLDGLWETVEASVDATPDIDRWCSGLDWVLPVNTAFAPSQEHLLLVADNADGPPDGFALLGKYHGAHNTPMYGGLEPLWGFGAPLFGHDLFSLTGRLVAHLKTRDDWATLFLPGVPAGDGVEGQFPQFTIDLATGLRTLGTVRVGDGISRRVADIGNPWGGYDGWLSRRSPKFRRNLRRAVSQASEAGLDIENASHQSRLLERLLAIERRSWKGQEESGITPAAMTAMYESMIDRLRRRDRLLAYVATLDGQDVGYILGGLRARRYRGLQISYTTTASELSVGNVLQDHQLRALTTDNLADVYDLGMDFDYKRRWADRVEPSTTLIINRGR